MTKPVVASVVSKPVLDWLLEESQPSVRYRTLTELLGRPENDADAREARKEIPEKGWAASILADEDARTSGQGRSRRRSSR